MKVIGDTCKLFERECNPLIFKVLIWVLNDQIALKLNLGRNIQNEDRPIEQI